MALSTWLITAVVYLSARSLAQQIYINQVPLYSSLDSSCAEPALSTVVRGQASGCGELSSYACFCSSSYSTFAPIISAAVLKACPGSTSDADSATQVFSEYCQLANYVTTGSELGAITIPPSALSVIATARTSFAAISASGTAASTSSTPESSAPASSITPAPSLNASTSSPPSATVAPFTGGSSGGLSSNAKIAVAVVVSVVGMGLVCLAGLYLCYRRKAFFFQKRSSSEEQTSADDLTPTATPLSAQSTRKPAVQLPNSPSSAEKTVLVHDRSRGQPVELSPEGRSSAFVEIDGRDYRRTLPSHALTAAGSTLGSTTDGSATVYEKDGSEITHTSAMNQV